MQSVNLHVSFYRLIFGAFHLKWLFILAYGFYNFKLIFQFIMVMTFLIDFRLYCLPHLCFNVLNSLVSWNISISIFLCEADLRRISKTRIEFILLHLLLKSDSILHRKNLGVNLLIAKTSIITNFHWLHNQFSVVLFSVLGYYFHPHHDF